MTEETMQNPGRDAGAGVLMIDSINYLRREHRGLDVLASSHGGLYTGFKAMSVGIRSLVVSDAGVGLDQAGIASLAYCDRADMPVAAISHLSARIGDAADLLARGRVSHANHAAAALGVRAGMGCREALDLLRGASPRHGHVSAMTEHRHELTLLGRRVICIDSASLIRPEDRGGIVLTGSHGGLIGGVAAKAINVPVQFAAFNDAGVGIEQAGIGRLAPLDGMGIAAVTVSSRSARIGDAMSTYEQGVVSHANQRARALGVKVGESLRQSLLDWLADRSGLALS